MQKYYKKIIKLSCTLCMAIILPACSQLNVSNPFETREYNVEDVYYGQFLDIPIPEGMNLDPRRSRVSISTSSSPTGLETYVGMIDSVSLNNAMLHNFATSGWTLEAAATHDKYIQIHQKGTLFALVYIYGDLLGTSMEIWLSDSLAAGQAYSAVIPQNNYAPSTETPFESSSEISDETSSEASTPPPASTYSEQLNN